MMATLINEPGCLTAPPPLAPPLKGEGGVNVSGFPSPLRGGVRGGGMLPLRPAGTSMQGTAS
jgi:hypothetical protein